MKLKISPPDIPEVEKTPLVLTLLSIIESQANQIGQLNEEIQLLKDEIARLKGQKPKPKISPSRLEKSKTKKSKSGKKKRAGSQKRHKTKELKIHDTQYIEPEYVPPNSLYKGYNSFVVQGLNIAPHNICYRLKTYETPDGQYVTGELPAHLNGKHYNPELIAYILYQHHHCGVTQPLLLEQLHEIGIDISKGTLNNILIEDKNNFHEEKDRILATGLEISSYINVDDTGARHKGKNGYCTHIGNESFSWFESTESKSRINFLKLLRAGHSDYFINMDAIVYMMDNKLPQKSLAPIIGSLETMFASDAQWNEFLAKNGIVKDRHVQIATEGALIGSIIEHGISKNLVIISDDAGQFNVLLHALCWIHAERTIARIIPFTDQAKEDLAKVRDQIWELYQELKKYKEAPSQEDKKRLEEMFDDIFTTKTVSATLNNALKRIHANKAELLLVLDRPEIPLHNNSAENAIREYVKKRKISGSTRSEAGRRCRDTFTSLKKTCRKLGLSFWHYLKDRVSNSGVVPDLSDLIREQVLSPG
jgi:hypothetical protein